MYMYIYSHSDTFVYIYGGDYTVKGHTCMHAYMYIASLLSLASLLSSHTDTLYRPGSVFLVGDQPPEPGSCSTCSSPVYSAPMEGNAKVTVAT